MGPRFDGYYWSGLRRSEERVEMRKTFAIFWVPVGLLLAVAVPVFIMVLYNMHPIKNSGAMVLLKSEPASAKSTHQLASLP
jgi:hypothetical protein